MPAETIWDRQRAAVRQEITRIAVEKFTSQGFDTTTVDEIVTAAGVSRRTFFRYFGTKEDIVLGDLAARGEVIATELGARPAEEDPWASMRAAFVASQATTMPDPAEALTFGRMLVDTPALRARLIEKRLKWVDLFTPILAAKFDLPTEQATFRATAIASAAVTCLDLASQAWLDGNGTGDLAAFYDEAVAALRA